MTWEFEFSLMVFLIIIFLSQAIAIKTKAKISLQFSLGVICIIGFASGIFPQDFIIKSKMIEVGIIAFNVLIVHSGTMLDVGKLKSQKSTIKLSLAAVSAMVIIVGFGLSPIIGKDLALLSPGPIVGSGATSAIASNTMLKINPNLSVFPWLLFMVQGFFGIPICAWAIKRETQRHLKAHRSSVSNDARQEGPSPLDRSTMDKDENRENKEKRDERPLCNRIPSRYKGTAYYLGILMMVSVFNRWLNLTLLSGLNIHPSVTALLLGILLGHFGIIDRDPLSKSDSLGFLMLGLMALMANTLAFTPTFVVVRMMMPVVIVFSVATIVLAAVGIVFSKTFGFSKYKGIAVTLSCMVGYPVIPIISGIVSTEATSDEEKQIATANLMPSLVTTSVFVVNVLSIFMANLLTRLL